MYIKTSHICFLLNISWLLPSSLIAQELPEQPTQIFGDHVWHQAYQDHIVNNEVVSHGHVQNLDRRYDHIKKIAAKYKRPFTVLDIGASQGYYSFRLGYDFPQSCCVMIEEDPYLQRLCRLNTDVNNVVFLQKRVTVEELRHLASCEHFDIVLALNIIHWSEEKWHEMAEVIFSLGERIVIETPPADDKGAIGAPYLGNIERYIELNGGEIIDQFPRNHTNPNLLANMYVVTKKKSSLQKPHWYALPNTNVTYQVKSTLKDKVLKKTVKSKKNTDKQIIETAWVPGINLLSFIMLHGVYPEVSMIGDLLEGLKNRAVLCKKPIHENILVTGNKLVLVPDDRSHPHDRTVLKESDISDLLTTIVAHA